MKRMRDLLSETLARGLEGLSDQDRLHLAWPIACGSALANHAEVLEMDAEGVLHVLVEDDRWREQMFQLRSKLCADVARIAGVRLSAIYFEQPPQRAAFVPRTDSRPARPPRRKSPK